MNLCRVLIVCLITFLVCSCSQKHTTTGYDFLEDFSPEQLSKIHTQSDALSMLGSPTYQVTHDKVYWYYFNAEVARPVISTPIIQKQRILVLSFNNQGNLVSHQYLGDEPPVTAKFNKDKTKVAGDNDNILYLLLGGLGKGGGTSSAVTK